MQVLSSPRFACLNRIYLEVIDGTEVFPNVNLCLLGSVQPHMQLPSPSPWTEVCIFPCIKTGSNLGQFSGKQNSKVQIQIPGHSIQIEILDNFQEPDIDLVHSGSHISWSKNTCSASDQVHAEPST